VETKNTALCLLCVLCGSLCLADHPLFLATCSWQMGGQTHRLPTKW
jgi:hypothetical protein